MGSALELNGGRGEVVTKTSPWCLIVLSFLADPYILSLFVILRLILLLRAANSVLLA